jgi:hypothetical protein
MELHQGSQRLNGMRLNLTEAGALQADQLKRTAAASATGSKELCRFHSCAVVS